MYALFLHSSPALPPKLISFFLCQHSPHPSCLSFFFLQVSNTIQCCCHLRAPYVEHVLNTVIFIIMVVRIRLDTFQSAPYFLFSSFSYHCWDACVCTLVQLWSRLPVGTQTYGQYSYHSILACIF